MKITSELGHKVIDRIAESIDLDINIMDLSGKIVASTNPVRINQIHSGAIEVIESNKAIIIDKTKMKDYPNTKPGMNLPINHQGKLRGIVGVSGNPQEILQVTDLIRVSVKIVLEQIYIQQKAGYKEVRWNYWLRELLHPSGFNQELLKKEAKYSLNINTEHDWKVIVLTGKVIQKSLVRVKQKLSHRRIDTLFILPFLKEEIIIALPAEFDQLDELIDKLIDEDYQSFKIGIGNKSFSIGGIRESYKQAKQALSFADTETTVAFSDNFSIKRLTHSISNKVYYNICSHYEKKIEQSR